MMRPKEYLQTFCLQQKMPNNIPRLILDWHLSGGIWECYCCFFVVENSILVINLLYSSTNKHTMHVNVVFARSNHLFTRKFPLALIMRFGEKIVYKNCAKTAKLIQKMPFCSPNLFHLKLEFWSPCLFSLPIA